MSARSIVVGRPVHEVFEFFADAENDPQWRREVKSIHRDGPLAVGARYTQRLNGPGGREIPGDLQVVALDPDSRVAFEVTAGPVRPRGEYRFRALGPDSTEVTFELDPRLTGIKKLVMGRMVDRSVAGTLAELDRAKQVLEEAA
jgi:uncharacterized membrane protein